MRDIGGRALHSYLDLKGIPTGGGGESARCQVPIHPAQHWGKGHLRRGWGERVRTRLGQRKGGTGARAKGKEDWKISAGVCHEPGGTSSTTGKKIKRKGKGGGDIKSGMTLG